jgi:hypothetical protein
MKNENNFLERKNAAKEKKKLKIISHTTNTAEENEMRAERRAAESKGH